jgi:FkbM family methyltransferase
MQMNDRLRFLFLVLVAIFVASCSNESSEDVSPATEAASPATTSSPPESAAGGAANPPPKKLNRYQQINQYREMIRNAPGRTGILGEKKRYSFMDEELIIRDFFQDRKGGFYLDVGCAWPIKSSNTYYLEENLGWTGIGIDALDDYADGWATARPKSRFFSYLVTDVSGGTGTFFKAQNTGLSSTDRERVMGWYKEEPLKVEIPMITLDDLLDREGVSKIDLLSMDIEGHEPAALRGFDLDRFQPELIVTEGNSPEVEDILNQHGYTMIERYVAFDPINRYFHRASGDSPPDPTASKVE